MRRGLQAKLCIYPWTVLPHERSGQRFHGVNEVLAPHFDEVNDQGVIAALQAIVHDAQAVRGQTLTIGQFLALNFVRYHPDEGLVVDSFRLVQEINAVFNRNLLSENLPVLCKTLDDECPVLGLPVLR